MHKYLKLLISILLVSLFYSVTIKPINSAGEFITDYEVTYQLTTAQTVNVSQKITLTNQLSQIYATKYTLTLQSGQLSNIQASDSLGPLKIETREDNDKTIINLTFNQQTIGNGKIYSFSVSYNSNGILNQNGRVTEVKIPKLANPEEINSYLLKIVAPSQLGELAYISPDSSNIQKKDNQTIYSFNKDQLIKNGVSLAFGDFQFFDFILNYHLDNPDTQNVQAEIALPPNTAFQEVYFQQLLPKPKNIYRDDDGNWMASYILKPKENLEITAQGSAQIFSKPQTNLLTSLEPNLQDNLGAQRFWEINDPAIITKARELKTIKNIYDYVVSSLKYDFNRVQADAQRLGAVQAMANPNAAICTEFTDLFISLCRASGIPAREINGYAYTTNEKLKPISLTTDVLHAWPEYWDSNKKVWLPVDPTWGNTTQGINYFDRFDLNHFAFVIHGKNSNQPLPAGAYKTNTNNTKDVQVTFGNYKEIPITPLSLTLNISNRIATGTKIQGTIVLENPNGKALYQPELNIKSTLSVNIGDVPTIILPYSEVTIPITIASTGKLDYGKKNLLITLNNKTDQFTIEVYNRIPVRLIVGGAICCFILLTGIIIFFIIKKGKRNNQ